MQGPFTLNQGGTGIAIIRVPDIFANSVQALSNFGYEYKLSKAASPLTTEYEEVYSSGAELTDPVIYYFELGGCSFQLEVMPSEGWNSGNHDLAIFLCGLLIIVLLTGLTVTSLVLEERREALKKMSSTDSLTGLLNRNGFDEMINYFLKNHPDEPCVGIQLDIDDFKFINDVYGHAAGDLALRILAESMREFSLILTGATCETARAQIEAFTSAPRFFQQDSAEHSFHISLGYAEYPADCEDASMLLRYADMALYEVKLHGKHSCLPYSQNFNVKKRSRLGFALRDISQNLPGAFLIYKAEPEDDHILLANREMIQYAGCKDIDEFLSYTGHSFRNLIRPDERQAVEESIWKQISSGESGTNDYVQFHFVKKDGSSHPVLDHGRIVENTYYGNVFYVTIMDCELPETHYTD